MCGTSAWGSLEHAHILPALTAVLPSEAAGELRAKPQALKPPPQCCKCLGIMAGICPTERNHPVVGEKADQQQDCPLYPNVLLLCLFVGNRIPGLGVPLVSRALRPEGDSQMTHLETSQACVPREYSLWFFPGVLSRAPCGSGGICQL